MANYIITDADATRVDEDLVDLVVREKLPPTGNKPDQIEYQEAEAKKKIKAYTIPDMNSAEIQATWVKIKEALDSNKFTEGELFSIIKVALNLVGFGKYKTPLMFGKTSSAERTNTYDTNYIGSITGKTQPSVPVIGAVGQQPEVTTETGESLSRAISFICAAFLRLVTKDADHIGNAMGSLRSTYGSMYASQSTFLITLEPPESWCDLIKSGLNTYPAARWTIALHLSESEANVPRDEESYGLIRFLLLQHVELMGMQIYKMSLTCLKDMENVQPSQFFTWILNPQSYDAIMNIKNVINTLDNADKVKASKLWKYAKLIDPQYFLSLSSSRNTYLCCVLAKLVKAMGLSGKGTYADPENMKAVAELPSQIKKRADADVDVIIQLYQMATVAKGKGVDTAYKITRGVKRAAPAETVPPHPTQEGPTPMDTSTGGTSQQQEQTGGVPQKKLKYSAMFSDTST